MYRLLILCHLRLLLAILNCKRQINQFLKETIQYGPLLEDKASLKWVKYCVLAVNLLILVKSC